MLEDEKIRAGVDPRKVRRESLLELGGAEQIKENVRDIRRGSAFTSVATELRQSLRSLMRNPSLTILGTFMLALGMGASISVFSIFQVALLQPLPCRDAGRLVEIAETRLDRGITEADFAEANFWDVRSYNHSFDEVASYHYDEANLTGIGEPEKVVASNVTAGFLRTLSVSPILGRDFSYDEDRNGYSNSVVIIGNTFWKTRFGGDPNIIGKTLRLDGRSYTVVGVLPPGEPLINDQLYRLFGHRPDSDRASWEFTVIARLKSGATLHTAQVDLQRLAGTLAQSFPKDDKSIGFLLNPSSTWIASDTTRRALWVLLGAVTFLLLIACLNMANLLLARGTARQREIAVRTALGASRARIVRYVMMESLLLNGFGTAAGLVLAYFGIRAVQQLDIRGIPRLADAGLNPSVLGFAVSVALLTGVLSGIAPALQAPVSRIAAALRDSDRQTGSRSQGHLRAALVTAEVAFSFLLLVGAGLLIRSFAQLMSADRGFQTENRLFFTVNMTGSYYERGVGKQFMDRLTERLRPLP